MGILRIGIKEDRAETQNKYTHLLILWNKYNNSCLPASYFFLYKNENKLTGEKT